MAISPYLASLRRRIGSELILMPSVAVMPFDAAGRLMLMRSADFGAWQTLGGAVDPGETPADAAIREAREESGLEMALTGLIGVYGGPDFRLTYPNGDVCEYVASAFSATVVGGRERADHDETLELGWFTSDEAAVLALGPHTRRLVRDAFRRAAGPFFPPADR